MIGSVLSCKIRQRGIVDVLTLLERYTTYVGRRLPTFRDSISVPSLRAKQSKEIFLDRFLDFLTLEDGTDRMSRNAGNHLPSYVS